MNTQHTLAKLVTLEFIKFLEQIPLNTKLINKIVNPKPKDEEIIEILTRKLDDNIGNLLKVSDFIINDTIQTNPILAITDDQSQTQPQSQEISLDFDFNYNEIDMYRRLAILLRCKRIYIVLLHLSRDNSQLINSIVDMAIKNGFLSMFFPMCLPSFYRKTTNKMGGLLDNVVATFIGIFSCCSNVDNSDDTEKAEVLNMLHELSHQLLGKLLYEPEFVKNIGNELPCRLLFFSSLNTNLLTGRICMYILENFYNVEIFNQIVETIINELTHESFHVEGDCGCNSHYVGNLLLVDFCSVLQDTDNNIGSTFTSPFVQFLCDALLSKGCLATDHAYVITRNLLGILHKNSTMSVHDVIIEFIISKGFFNEIRPKWICWEFFVDLIDELNKDLMLNLYFKLNLRSYIKQTEEKKTILGNIFPKYFMITFDDFATNNRYEREYIIRYFIDFFVSYDKDDRFTITTKIFNDLRCGKLVYSLAMAASSHIENISATQLLIMFGKIRRLISLTGTLTRKRIVDLILTFHKIFLKNDNKAPVNSDDVLKSVNDDYYDNFLMLHFVTDEDNKNIEPLISVAVTCLKLDYVGFNNVNVFESFVKGRFCKTISKCRPHSFVSTIVPLIVSKIESMADSEAKVVLEVELKSYSHITNNNRTCIEVN